MAGKRKKLADTWADQSVYAMDRAAGNAKPGFAGLVNRAVQKATKSKSEFEKLDKKAKKARGY